MFLTVKTVPGLSTTWIGNLEILGALGVSQELQTTETVCEKVSGSSFTSEVME